jgi:protein-tyrosine phosphatase
MGKKIKRVLFMCMGNTCRSPAAEYIAKAIKSNELHDKLKEVEFDSAGFFNFYKYAQPETVEFVEGNYDIEMSDFKGKVVDNEMLEEQDLILVMQERHMKRLKRKFKEVPNLEEKAAILLEFAGEKNTNIPDPMNLSPQEYEEVMRKVEKGVKKSLEKIKQINEQN